MIDYRNLSARLIEHACGHNPSELDKIYSMVTEGRDPQTPYSSCADLGHWELYRLGVRLDLINRKEHKGFVYGVNVSRLAWCEKFGTDKPLWHGTIGVGEFPECGDILIVWNRVDTKDAHVMCMLENNGQSFLVGEYGQPGGALHNKIVTYRNGEMHLSGRKVQRWLKLPDVLHDAEQRGQLVEPDVACLDLKT